jgi:hypothetical protein
MLLRDQLASERIDRLPVLSHSAYNGVSGVKNAALIAGKTAGAN